MKKDNTENNKRHWVKQWKKAAGLHVWNRLWYSKGIEARALGELDSLAVRIYGRTKVGPKDVSLLSYSAQSVGQPIPLHRERKSILDKAPFVVAGDFKKVFCKMTQAPDATEEKTWESLEDFLRLAKRFRLAPQTAYIMDYK